MCTSAAIWAKMAGIVYGASQEDAIKYSKAHPSNKLSWRQIKIKARQVVLKSDHHIELYEGICHEECLKLFEI